MSQQLLMPKLGLTMTEGVLAEWRVEPGMAFAKGDVICVVESDKTLTDITAEADGTLSSQAVAAGDTVDVSGTLGTWTAREQLAVSSDAGRIPITPLARRLAREAGIDATRVAGSGPGSRVRARDVLGALERGVADASEDAAYQKPSAIQAAMARRLGAAKQEIPHFYMILEADVTPMLHLREEIHASNASAAKITLNTFVLAAAGRALLHDQQANSVWTADGIRMLTATDVGMAVSTPRGLFAPVLRDVGRVALAEVARRADDAARAAHAGTLSAEQMRGGSVTVSNAGMHNVTYLTPIINPGQTMILGVGSVRELFRPDARGQPVLRREMGLVLAADHRILDGVAGLRYLNKVASLLQQPRALLGAHLDTQLS